ncbi:MAG TPA: SH3 domain-containing protein [Clostridia bacterium]|nr:SH3 domain-containing protein [Clostridia bacterium]
MRNTRLGVRLTAFVLCMMTVLAVFSPALAAEIYCYGTVNADNTPVYSNQNATAVLGVFNKNDLVAIESQISASGLYIVRLGPSTASTGYIRMSAVPDNTRIFQLTSGAALAQLKSSSGAAVNTGNLPEGTLGTIVNVKKNVNFRSGPSNKSARVKGQKSVPKGASVSIIGEESGFYKLVYKGKTGYVDTRYVAAGGTVPSTPETTPPGIGQGTDTGRITIGTGKIAVEAYKSKPVPAVETSLNSAKAANKNTIGYMYLNGTNIQQPILYNVKGIDYSKYNFYNKKSAEGAVYSLYGKDMTRNNVITGHNMRKSNGMLHQLHHIQEKTLGYTKCQMTEATCAISLDNAPDIKVQSNRIWDISLFGYNKWEVWAMYETAAKESKNTINYNINHLAKYSPSQIKTWIEYQKNRSEYKFNTAVSTDDIFLTLYTCGNNYDSSSAQSRLYFFLKAVS